MSKSREKRSFLVQVFHPSRVLLHDQLLSPFKKITKLLPPLIPRKQGNNSVNRKAKLLVTTGYNNGYITSTEVIDLNDPNVTCQQWPDYPIDVYDGVGGYLNDSVITCGGFYDYDGIDKCFKMEPTKVTEITGLKIGSYGSGGGIIQDSLIISGGYGKHIF